MALSEAMCISRKGRRIAEWGFKGGGPQIHFRHIRLLYMGTPTAKSSHMNIIQTNKVVKFANRLPFKNGA